MGPQGSTSRGKKARLSPGLDTGPRPGVTALPLPCLFLGVSVQPLTTAPLPQLEPPMVIKPETRVSTLTPPPPTTKPGQFFSPNISLSHPNTQSPESSRLLQQPPHTCILTLSPAPLI